jgi:16S rRNA (cytidine1402-2'-O)-methyltransferase
LPSDRFLFAGFPPAAGAARRRWVDELRDIPATLVLYESPRRIGELLTVLAEHLGNDRRAVVCRELTKRHEEVARDSLGALAERFAGAAPKGEVVVLVDRGTADRAAREDIDAALQAALATMTVKDAAEAVAKAHGLARRDVYQAALRLAGKG